MVGMTCVRATVIYISHGHCTVTVARNEHQVTSKLDAWNLNKRIRAMRTRQSNFCSYREGLEYHFEICFNSLTAIKIHLLVTSEFARSLPLFI
jgi:hypothetical protein